MELEEFKSAYQQASKQKTDKEALRQMMRTGNHPVLKGIRNQLILESVLWMIFLAVYYDFFDGHLKPLLWNILLVLSVVLLLIHHLLGYQLTRKLIHGNNIKVSFQNYLKRTRTYSILSVISRVTAILIIFGYFFSTVKWSENKYWIFAFLLLVLSVQIYLLKRLWANRINRIKSTYAQLS